MGLLFKDFTNPSRKKITKQSVWNNHLGNWALGNEDILLS